MGSEKERRDSLRLRVNPGNVRIQKPDLIAGSTVVDLSAKGGGLLVAPGADLDKDGTYLELALGPDDLVRARIKLARRHPVGSGKLLLGVSFEDMDVHDLGVLSQFLMTRYGHLSSSHSMDYLLGLDGFGASIRNQVQGLVDYYLFKRGEQLNVFGEKGRTGKLMAVEQQVLQGVLLIRLEVRDNSCSELLPGKNYLFYFSGTNSLNLFFSSVWKINNSQVWITFPGRIKQTGFRKSMRTRVADGGVFLEFVHPRLAGVHVTKPVVDVAARGLSFPVEPRRDVLFPGDRIKGLKIHVSGLTVDAYAVIRSVKTDSVTGALLCGIEINGFGTARGEERWDRFVIGNQYPSSHLGDASDVDELWHVLDSSGYLKEYVSEKKDILARSFFSCWRHNANNSSLGRFLLLKKNHRAVGTVSVSLVYPGTWMVHHFGIDKSARLDKLALFSIARDAYCSLAYLLQQTSFIRYWLVFFDSGNRWKKWICTDFVSRYSDPNDFVYNGYSLFKWSGAKMSQAPSCTNVRIKSDERFDGLLSDRLRATCHPLEFNAYSYSMQGLAMRGFEKSCLEQGYERSRTVYYALFRQKPVAALLAETGHEGVNIFGLMNRCIVVELVDDVPQRDIILRCLLYKAVEHYSARGKQEFLFMGHETMNRDIFSSLGIGFVTKGIRLLAGKKILPTYLNYLDELLRILHG